ncbi:MAG TPA: tetratricopeptide repeat protein [Phototrophicaceae bacterium]|nr:tetratricopeptide repeat protein [Phototrophicaceae bacterium]
MERRRLWVIAIYITVVLAVVGIVVFIGALVAQYFSPANENSFLSPFVMIALAGLCVAAFMFLLWFTAVGVLLARQTRAQGSGYGDAYRLIEAFRFREAIPLLERSIREGKETSEVLMLLTSAYAYTGQLAKAQQTADRAVQLFPGEPASYITLANGYRMQAAYDSAAQTLEEAAKLDPDQPIVWAELGFTQRFAGEQQTAIQSFERAAQHAMPAPYGVRVYYHLANAYQAAGETKQAVRAAAKMMSARDGLTTWKAGLKALEGTAYGQALRYEIAAIEQAIADADAGNLG